MRVLFIQQDHVSPVGPVGARFAERGYEVEGFGVVPADRFHSPGVDAEFPDPLAYDAIVPMGAPWSVYDEATIGAWVLEEVSLLRRAHDAGVPILAICFGAQALATALGGGVERAPHPEIGWMRIDTEAPDLVPAGPWFQWHHDRMTPPPAATVLARSALAVQAYQVGRSLGVQFHPELTAAMLDGWLDNGGDTYLTEHGYDPAAIRAETLAEEPAAIQRAADLVDVFCDRIAVRPR